MAKIKSKAELIANIKSQLGAPTIKIEVTDPQIGEIIDAAVTKFTEYAYGTLEGTVIIQLDGAKDYPMPDAMTNLIKLSKGSTSNLTNFGSNFGAGYVPDIWSAQYFSGSLTGDIIPTIISLSSTKAVLDKYFGDDIHYNYNPWRNVLQVLENYKGAAVLHYQYEYIPNELNDRIYDHEWIREYCRARVKELWSTVTGKYDQSLIGGSRVNYDKMASEAERDIERLHEALLTKWSDPAPIDVA